MPPLHTWAELLDDLLVGGCSRQVSLMTELIAVDPHGAETLQSVCYRALARPAAARQTNHIRIQRQIRLRLETEEQEIKLIELSLCG